MIRAVLAAVLVWLATALPAAAHEVRPALVQILQTAPGDYEVTWKQPVVGDMAVRLRPHLSSGAIDRRPDAETSTAAFLVRTWEVRGGAPLAGQTLTIEGLPQSVTDALVRIRAPDGTEINTVLKPASPSMRIGADAPQALAVPAYLLLGIEHILTGPDHLLFVLGLLLLIGPRWGVLKAVTGFTVAHSLTLALAALGYMRFPSAVIEALVALSIVFVARELLVKPAEPTLTQRWPWVVAFAFGLLHGLAFAGALSDIGLPKDGAVLALLLFNVGVEIGQLMFIAGAVAVILALRRIRLRAPVLDAPWAQALPAYVIGGLAAFWVIERVLAV